MQPFQQRVVDEKKELEDKRTKLSAFLDSTVFRSLVLEEQLRLIRQSKIMTEYSQVLGERIEAFK